MERKVPPDDISPLDFFTRWVPAAVAGDEERRRKLADTNAKVVFELSGDGGGSYTLWINEGSVTGALGGIEDPDLRVVIAIDTWRQLNRGDIGAPEALLKRRLKLHGDFLLGLKLHLILG
jgi:putative sterol carrier protein